MLANVLDLSVFAGVSVFLANRLYVGLRKKQITVKGVTYKRYRNPYSYWTTLCMALIGLVIGFGLSLVSIFVLIAA